MSKPKKPESEMVATLSFQVPRSLLERLDGEVERVAGETRIDLSRSNLVRILLEEALEHRTKAKRPKKP